MDAERRLDILGIRVDAVNLDEAVRLLSAAAADGKSGYVCVTGVHGVMECQRDAELARIHNQSLLTVPDGMPLVVLGRRKGFESIGRVYGPDLMLRLLDRSVAASSRHFFCGATTETLACLERRLLKRFPGLEIAGTYAPAFGPVTRKEIAEVASLVARTRPDFVWIGMSTPKQERFMAALHAAGARGIFLGVGAAFNLHAFHEKDAPSWMRTLCLHWLYRFWKEPGRLWKRYAFIIPAFLWALFRECMAFRPGSKRAAGTGEASGH